MDLSTTAASDFGWDLRLTVAGSYLYLGTVTVTWTPQP